MKAQRKFCSQTSSINVPPSQSEAKFHIHMRPQIDLKLRNSFMKFVVYLTTFSSNADYTAPNERVMMNWTGFGRSQS
jgi:hypothetical protein